MSRKQFVSPHRGRMIEVRVDEMPGWITFHFSQEQDREFYSIPLLEWKDDRNHWVKHMTEKNWFSDKMIQFIDKSISNG